MNTEKTYAQQVQEAFNAKSATDKTVFNIAHIIHSHAKHVRFNRRIKYNQFITGFTDNSYIKLTFTEKNGIGGLDWEVGILHASVEDAVTDALRKPEIPVTMIEVPKQAKQENKDE